MKNMTKKEIEAFSYLGVIGVPEVYQIQSSDTEPTGKYSIKFLYIGSASVPACSVNLVTTRGDSRLFRTLDAAASFLDDCGFAKFDVSL